MEQEYKMIGRQDEVTPDRSALSIRLFAARAK
jgi:hypothetical protein